MLELYRNYLHLLARTQLDLHVKTRANASDMVQETFLVITAKAANFQRGTNFRAWAWTIARYKVLQTLEKNAPAPVTLADKLNVAMESASEVLADFNAVFAPKTEEPPPPKRSASSNPASCKSA